MKRAFSRWAAAAAALALTTAAWGHDTWLQANTNVVHTGDAVYIDFMLGNHGNDHRDFKLAGKAPLAGSQIEAIGPDGSIADLKPLLRDEGMTPKDGYWSARFEPTAEGLYLIAQSSDEVASYAPVRIVRSAKTFFVVGESLDRVAPDLPGYDRALGDPLELVPQVNPVSPMGPGALVRVKLLFHGQPLAGERVSFIPNGETLAPGFDSMYERRTDAQGLASFNPREANRYLVVAHHDDPAKGAGYGSTKYSATLTFLVPVSCPCGAD